MGTYEKSYSILPWSGASPFSSLTMAVRNCFPDEGFDSTRLATSILWDQNWEPDGTFVLREQGEGGRGAVRGFCVAIHRKIPLPHMPLDSDKGYITLFGVDEKLRRQGYGAQLLNAAEQYLRVEGAKRALVSPYAPGYFWPGVDVERYTAAVAFLMSRGYTEIMRPLAMETQLSKLRRPEWLRRKIADLKATPSTSVEIREYHPDLVPFVHDFMVEEFPGDWERWVRDAALDIHAGRSKSDRLLFAWDNATNSVVGMVHWNKERFGPVGTAPRVRGRGIGAWLTFEALERMRAAGKNVAWFLWTDDKTAELYKEAGFQETRRFALMGKDL
jgi:GNAT superfamily N-acetyltransferase